MKLGKRSRKDDSRTLRLANYLSAVPSPPTSIDWTSDLVTYPMLGNAKIGDCTIAMAAHMVEIWTLWHHNTKFIPYKKVLKAYRAVSGYRPRHPKTDRGAALLDVMNYWRNKGIGGHKIDAFAAIDKTNETELHQAIWLFGGAPIGLNMPISAQGQATWDVPPGGAIGNGDPGSWGGHAVPIVKYAASEPKYMVVSWDTVYPMTSAFLATYCDEAYAVLSRKDWIGKANAPNGFDDVALEADIVQLEGLVNAA